MQTNVVSAKYILKTDDDSFVRVDQILNSLKTIGTTSGLLYGFITSNSQPDRTNGSNWYVSSEVLLPLNTNSINIIRVLKKTLWINFDYI